MHAMTGPLNNAAKWVLRPAVLWRESFLTACWLVNSLPHAAALVEQMWLTCSPK
jgi:hypothetical protein